MLPTQVQYWSMKENQRHNLVSEQLERTSINEGIRHNKMSESLTLKSIQETTRHNKVSESQNQQSINEVIRHNRKTESQTDWYNSEVKRHNLASESIGRTQASAAMISANAAKRSASAALQQAHNSSMMVAQQGALLPFQTRNYITSSALNIANAKKAEQDAKTSKSQSFLNWTNGIKIITGGLSKLGMLLK